MTGAGYKTICTDEVGEGKHCIRYDRYGNRDKNGSRSISYDIYRKSSNTEIDNIKSTDSLKYFAVDNGCCCRMYPCSNSKCEKACLSDTEGTLRSLAFAICLQADVKTKGL
ncbi:MAG: hypothetical protein AB9835_00570 [Eubacteriales bacterium]